MQLGGDRDPRRATPEDVPDRLTATVVLALALLGMAVAAALLRVGGVT